jgi:hypothetical protein
MADANESDDGPVMIECPCHGKTISAVVCGHLAGPIWPRVGFVENSSDPNDQQAWCDACERMFLDEGEMTERFRAFNDTKLVCSPCYAEIKQRHSR